MKVTYTLKDAYDRTYTKTITVKLVNQKINIDSFKSLTAAMRWTLCLTAAAVCTPTRAFSWA